MIQYELSQLQDNPPWLDVLRAYSEAAPNEEGWLTRVSGVEGIEDEDLPRIHGKLIAFGFLDFQLADRHEGVFYQLTSLGRQGLIRLRDNADDSEDATAEELAESDEIVDEIAVDEEVAEDAAAVAPG